MEEEPARTLTSIKGKLYSLALCLSVALIVVSIFVVISDGQNSTSNAPLIFSYVFSLLGGLFVGWFRQRHGMFLPFCIFFWLFILGDKGIMPFYSRDVGWLISALIFGVPAGIMAILGVSFGSFCRENQKKHETHQKNINS